MMYVNAEQNRMGICTCGCYSMRGEGSSPFFLPKKGERDGWMDGWRVMDASVECGCIAVHEVFQWGLSIHGHHHQRR